VSDPRHSARYFKIAGAAVFLAGAVAVLVPAVASVAVAIFVGWVLLFVGVATALSALMHAGHHRILRGLWGLVSVAVGLYLVLAPLEGTITLTFVLIVNFLIMGSMRIAAWWASRETPGAGAMGANGAFSILIALLVLVDFPSSAGWAIGLLVGIDLMFGGIALWSAGREVQAPPSPTAQPAV
jgi:uncharacterized membrane protein HdeD (DUF308 family)